MKFSVSVPLPSHLQGLDDDDYSLHAELEDLIIAHCSTTDRVLRVELIEAIHVYADDVTAIVTGRYVAQSAG